MQMLVATWHNGLQSKRSQKSLPANHIMVVFSTTVINGFLAGYVAAGFQHPPTFCKARCCCMYG